MGWLVFLLIAAFPVAEVYVLIKVASRIGFGDTLFLLIFSGVFGAYLASIQGKITLNKMQACLAQNKLPTKEMIDGLLIFLGGILFIIPGFISDIIGFFLIFPLTRWVIRMGILHSAEVSLSRRAARGASQGPEGVNKGPVSTEGFNKGNAQDAEIVE
ncbi:MAG: FxsA family protein [Candidatus Omnitrophica bacterium]|nr:FxsA family protein [Candidatus Omnitrophota bacterium]